MYRPGVPVNGVGQAFRYAPGLGSSGLAVTAWSKNADGSAPESGAISDWATVKYVVISNP
jgi:hypothetical protein